MGRAPTQPPAAHTLPDLATRIDAALPQTQCTRCGFPDCKRYAEAIANGAAAINQCPPGGAQGIGRLAAITGLPRLTLNASHGAEGPRRLAVIDETWCIGCTLCLHACPVDCIVGSHKRMHTVIEPLCTGCELCLPACPVDCISLQAASSGERSGWDAWSAAQANESRERYAWHRLRSAREQQENEPRLAAESLPGADAPAHDAQLADTQTAQHKQAVIAAALARSRAQRRDG